MASLRHFESYLLKKFHNAYLKTFNWPWQIFSVYSVYIKDNNWFYQNWVQHSRIKPVLSWRDCCVKDSEQVYWHKTNVRVGYHHEHQCQMKIPLTAKGKKVNVWKWPKEKNQKNWQSRFVDAWFEITTISFSQRHQVSFLSGGGATGLAPGAAVCKCEIGKGTGLQCI